MGLNTNGWNRLRYSLYAPIYDLVVARPFERARAKSIASLGLQGGENILVVGCGTGLDFRHLPRTVHLTAGDISPAMVKRASAEAVSLGFEQVDVRVLDAHRLGLPRDAFDVVLLHLVLAVVPDPHAAIREAARVLKPGGRVAVLDKFLPDGTRPSFLRRSAAVVTSVIATDLNRQLGPLLSEASLVLKQRTPAMLGGLFETALAIKAG